MKYFLYDSVKDEIKLNEPEILLTKEFAKLYLPERNKTKTDKTGEFRAKAFNEFKYIFLYYDWTSPYAQFLSEERHNLAVEDSGLSKKELEDPDFLAACKKYEEIQNSSLAIKLLQAARMAVENSIFYLGHVDLNERDQETGKPIYKFKDLIAEIKGCKDILDGLNGLEAQVKRELEVSTGLRGDTEAGLFDD